jgi:hypothetical protein
MTKKVYDVGHQERGQVVDQRLHLLLCPESDVEVGKQESAFSGNIVYSSPTELTGATT